MLTDADGNPTDIIAQNGEIVGDMNRFFRIVTLNFLAGGGVATILIRISRILNA